MINFLLLVSRYGKVRLTKWYIPLSHNEKLEIVDEVSKVIARRPSRFCSILEHKGRKYVCRKYASLLFVAGIDPSDNELIVLEIIHLFVQALDRYFGNVCELDVIFNFHRVYFLLDEVLLAGELQERSLEKILPLARANDLAAEKSENVSKSYFKKILKLM